MGGGYEVKECNADWYRLSDRAFWCCRTSQDITLINVVYFSGGVTAEHPKDIIV